MSSGHTTPQSLAVQVEVRQRETGAQQLRSRQKGSDAVGKTKRGKGTKWMVLVEVEVFRWEFGWKVPLQQKLRSNYAIRLLPRSLLLRGTRTSFSCSSS